MSYILEALKKADAQRGQGQVPGLHSQHMPPEFAQTPANGNPLLIWIIMAMGTALIAVMLWATWQSDVPSATTTASSTLAAPPAGPAQMTPPAAAMPAPINPLPDEHDLPRHFRQSTGHANSATGAPHRVQSGVSPASAPADTAPAAPAVFPKLTFGGAMHSENAESRMLIINGQLHREGDTVAPGLVLERIELKSATFRHQGQRHVVQY